MKVMPSFKNVRPASRKLLEWEWWAYLFIVVSFFMTCLGLNYVVKKINEAKIDERFIRMLHKASTAQSTQVNGPMLVMETNKLRQNTKTAQSSPTGISLVFNQDENKRRKDLEDTINIIKKSMNSNKFEALSLNTNKSLETIDLLPLNRSDLKVNDVPVKMIESGRINSKESSSHNVTKKVLVIKTEFGQDRDTPLVDESDCYASELISIKRNKDGYVAAKRTTSIIQTDSNKSELTSVNESARIVPRKTTFLIQSDSNANENVITKKCESTNKSGRIRAEETSSNQRNDYEVTKYVPIKNNDSGCIAEDIDVGSFIKKTVDCILSQIANKLKTTSDDAQNEKSTTDRSAAKETSSNSRSSRSITELSLDKKRDSGGIAATETFKTRSDDDDVAELGPVKMCESGRIVVNETSSLTGNGNTMVLSLDIKKDLEGIAAKETTTRNDDNVAKLSPVKIRKSGSMAAKETPFRIVRDRIVTETSVTNKTSDSRDIAVKETFKTQSEETSSDERSERNVTEYIQKESGHLVTNTSIVIISPNDSQVFDVLCKSNEDIELSSFTKKTEDITVSKIADTSKTKNDVPEKGKALKDRIKALLTPPMLNEDIMILKPSSSRKKK